MGELKKKEEIKSIGKGKCILLTVGEANLPPGASVCQWSNCPLKNKQLISGMYCVELKNKFYHASCATQIGIDFKVPIHPKRKKEAD